ncbi:hypothetical protein PO250_01375 [Limosilactobacillus mucosae]|uniref:Uncharacterized protein n=1 Tax=Limosilactobacillus mucosae TaxID=97478 RepID=A0AAJ1M897_LIMMU|nr:hypothetical protein [Limosilactobacillus mucosae]MDC2828987.1 hypothetical protein [Limosilactobacillus mucosae]
MVNLKNETTNQVKQCKLGWSWTVFFFSFWPMLFRQDWIYLICYAAWEVIGNTIAFSNDGAFITVSSADFIIRIVMSVMYNTLYVKGLLKKGWKPADEASKKLMQAKGIVLTESAKSAEKAANQSVETPVKSESESVEKPAEKSETQDADK